MSDNGRCETYFGRVEHLGRQKVLGLSRTAISEISGVKSRHTRPKLLTCVGGATTGQERSLLATFIAFYQQKSFRQERL